MSLVVVGLNHHTSHVDLRERLAFSEEAIPVALWELRRHLENSGAVIVSTCNRVEVYLHHDFGEPTERLHAIIRHFLSEWHQIHESEFRDALYQYEGRETVEHIFRVAASLDSMVIGEAQVLGQVQEAYLAAQSEGATDKVMNALFQRAFAVAKNVRTHSTLGEGKVSISSVAVDLASSIFDALDGKTVMVIGSGEMGGLTLSNLMSRGLGKVLVANRSKDRAQALAEAYHGEPLVFHELPEYLHQADIVISATGAPDLVLYQRHFEQAMTIRKGRPMFIIDIAVPRDVDAAANTVDGVYLYNVDDLEAVVNQNLNARHGEIDTCMAIVEQGVSQFMAWMKGLLAEPTIVSVAEELHAIRERELDKTLASLPDLTEKQQHEIRYLTERIVGNILQRPMTHIKHEITHHDPGTVIHLVKRIFGLEETS